MTFGGRGIEKGKWAWYIGIKEIRKKRREIKIEAHLYINKQMVVCI